MNPREQVKSKLRLHPRIAYQGLCDDARRTRLGDDLPELVPFGGAKYRGLIAILDWDHRLPSKQMILRLYAYTSEEAFTRGEHAYDARVEEIGKKDRFPEFDVPDFEGLPADEAYDLEVG